MDKYYEHSVQNRSRMQKNEQLYQSINDNELDTVNLASNAHVIGENNNNNIDINKIKELLEKKYYEAPKKTNAIRIYEEQQEEIDDEEETKEYDINAILKKAKIGQNVDYERERLKKIHDTQYDILKNLDLEKEKQESKVTSDKENLMNLINTITEKEMTRELNPLDILSDLKGSENTVVLEGTKDKKDSEEKKKIEKQEEIKDEDKSFYTNSLSFTQSDFDDFNDLKEDVESNKILVRVLLFIVGLTLVIGIVFLLNTIFHLNWF